MTLRVKDYVELGNHVLIQETNDPCILVYRQHFGPVTRVVCDADGYLHATPPAQLESDVYAEMMRIFTKLIGR